MLLLWLVSLLAMTALSQGAAVAREERDTVVDKMDWTFELLGIHMGFKSNDSPYPWKGGTLHLIIEDLQKIVKDARSNRVEVDIALNMDMHAFLRFQANVKYSMMHSDGSGEEMGKFMIKNSFSGGTWSFAFKSEASPFTGLPIFPGLISKQDFKIKAGPSAKDEFQIQVKNGAKIYDLTLKSEKLSSPKGESHYQITIEGTYLGAPVNLTGKFKETRLEKTWDEEEKTVIGERGRIWKFDLEKDSKTLIQIETKSIELPGPMYLNFNFEAITKYSFLGGSISGLSLIRLEDGPIFTISYTDDNSKHSIALVMTITPNDLRRYMNDLGIEVTENEESILKTVVTMFRSRIILDVALNTKLKLGDKSKIYKFLKEKYPYGTFNEGNMKIQIFVDMQNWNLLGPQLKIGLQLQKDGILVVDLLADTTSTPYTFKLPTPSIFRIWGTNQLTFETTVNHQPGSLVIDSDINGGLNIEGSLDNNENNGKNFSLNIRREGIQMLKITGSTVIINDDDQFRIVLYKTVDINPDSLLYKIIIDQHRILSPFQAMAGNFGLNIDKNSKISFLNKFHLFGDIKKDDEKVFGYWVSLTELPYKALLFAPSVLDQLNPGMSEAEIYVDQSPDKYWNIVTNFLGEIKIYNTNSSISTKLNLGDEFLEPNLTWEGQLPQTLKEAEKFLSKNNMIFKVTGLELDIKWELILHEKGKISLNAKGKNKRWGDYSFSRNINWKVEDGIVDLDIAGTSHFSEGILATSTPTETSVMARVIPDQRDFIGKFMKKVNGKEYSVNLYGIRRGLPKIIWGQ